MKKKDEQATLFEMKNEEPSVLLPGQKLKRWNGKRPRCKVKKDS